MRGKVKTSGADAGMAGVAPMGRPTAVFGESRGKIARDGAR